MLMSAATVVQVLQDLFCFIVCFILLVSAVEVFTTLRYTNLHLLTYLLTKIDPIRTIHQRNFR